MARDRGRLMRIGRPRISTLVLSGLFLAVLALYLWVRPLPVDTASPGPATSPAAFASDSRLQLAGS